MDSSELFSVPKALANFLVHVAFCSWPIILTTLLPSCSLSPSKMTTLHAAAFKKHTGSRHISDFMLDTNFLSSTLGLGPPLFWALSLLPAARRVTTVLISASMLACSVCGSFRTWRRMLPTTFCKPANLR